MDLTDPLYRAVSGMTEQELAEALEKIEAQKSALDAWSAIYVAALARLDSAPTKGRPNPAKAKKPRVKLVQPSAAAEGKKAAVSAGGKRVVLKRKANPNRGRAAIKRIMETDTGRVWSIEEITKRAIAEGWDTNPHNVQVALSRMHADGEVKRPKPSRFILTPASGANDDLNGAG